MPRSAGQVAVVRVAAAPGRAGTPRRHAFGHVGAEDVEKNLTMRNRAPSTALTKMERQLSARIKVRQASGH